MTSHEILVDHVFRQNPLKFLGSLLIGIHSFNVSSLRWWSTLDKFIVPGGEPTHLGALMNSHGFTTYTKPRRSRFVQDSCNIGDVLPSDFHVFQGLCIHRDVWTVLGQHLRNMDSTWGQRQKEGKTEIKKKKGSETTLKQHKQEDKNRKEGQKEGGKASSLVVADYFLVCDFYRSKCQNPAKLMPRDDQAPQWCSSVPKKQKEAQPTKTIQELCLLFCLQVKRSSGKKSIQHPTPLQLRQVFSTHTAPDRKCWLNWAGATIAATTTATMRTGTTTTMTDDDHHHHHNHN